MTQREVENKYGFVMRVSARPMAGIDLVDATSPARISAAFLRRQHGDGSPCCRRLTQGSTFV